MLPSSLPRPERRHARAVEADVALRVVAGSREGRAAEVAGGAEALVGDIAVVEAGPGRQHDGAAARHEGRGLGAGHVQGRGASLGKGRARHGQERAKTNEGFHGDGSARRSTNLVFRFMAAPADEALTLVGGRDESGAQDLAVWAKARVAHETIEGRSARAEHHRAALLDEARGGGAGHVRRRRARLRPGGGRRESREKNDDVCETGKKYAYAESGVSNRSLHQRQLFRHTFPK